VNLLLAILLVVAGPLGVLLLIALWDRWWLRRTLKRILASTPTIKEQEQGRLFPESLYIVKLSSDAVSCERPDGKTESVRWDDLREVEIITTDQGPFVPDVFWVLHGATTGCVIPEGATGERELMERFQHLPGFRFEAVIKANVSAQNQRFVCWEKPGQNNASDG
jgi:hypothetical protein